MPKYRKVQHNWKMEKILIVEDNELIATGIKDRLKDEGFLVDISNNIKEAMQLLTSNKYNLILLDIVLPDGNGINFYKTIKELSNHTAVIFLTAKDTEDDIVRGLELGADDYIVKPFRTRELISRIRNVLRRSKNISTIQIGNIQFDRINNVIYKENNIVELTALEYKIFCILIDNLGKLVTREYLLGRIWDISANFVNDNTLTVYMKRLREKIEDDPNNPKIIKTIRGIGYKVDKNEK